MTDEYVNEVEHEAALAEADEATDTSTQYGVGPFTVREVAILGAWVIAFIVSFFSISQGRFDSVWTSGLQWILTIGVPTVAVFLIVLRRFSPDGIRRVGSLGIDQFASVAFSVASVVWLQLLWETIAFAAASGQWVRTWVVWVELALMLALVVLTVFAPLIDPLCDDFAERPEVPAHRNARPVRPVVARPPRVRPVAVADDSVFAEPSPYAPEASAAPFAGATPYVAADPAGIPGFAPEAATPAPEAEWNPGYARTGVIEPIAEPIAEPEPEPEPAAHPHQAFWALAPVERDVVDERGIPIFRVGPTAWALVIEDRGAAYVIRHEDGRIGYLHDVTGITRG